MTVRLHPAELEPDAIDRAAIQRAYRVIHREAHTVLEELADVTLADARKAYLADSPRCRS
jgi:hypothetical protein